MRRLKESGVVLAAKCRDLREGRQILVHRVNSLDRDGKRVRPIRGGAPSAELFLELLEIVVAEDARLNAVSRLGQAQAIKEARMMELIDDDHNSWAQDRGNPALIGLKTAGIKKGVFLAFEFS